MKATTGISIAALVAVLAATPAVALEMNAMQANLEEQATLTAALRVNASLKARLHSNDIDVSSVETTV